jgi:DNA polymerase kappa
MMTATKTASALMVAASEKAGMEDIDRERINAILLRESGDSAFMERQRKMDENSNKRIAEMKHRLSEKDNNTANKMWRDEMERTSIDPQLEKYRSKRRPLSTCVVIDMDSFFISCHILDQPHLAHVPACVGGSSMISTSNYVARRYGVRAAMPGYLGRTLVNELSRGKETLTFVKSDFNLYKKKSAEVRSILLEYDPKLKMYSLDEAYMDVMPYLEAKLKDNNMTHEAIKNHLNSNTSANLKAQTTWREAFSESTIQNDVQNLLHSIRQRVKDVTGLTCSAGIASNFLLAKIASDINKPNGQHYVGAKELQIQEFIKPLPIRKINGIGRVMEKILFGACGIESVKDLFDSRAEVQFLLKPATADFLLRASIGYSDCYNHPEDECCDTGEEATERKGISHEQTFAPTSSWSDLCNKLESITLSLIHDLRERNLMPRTVTLKLKLASFDVLTRAVTRNVAFVFDQESSRYSSAQELVDVAVTLMKEAKMAIDRDRTVKSRFSVRLLGVRCSNFQLHKETQFSLDRYRRKNVINPYASPKRDAANSTIPLVSTSSQKEEATSVSPNILGHDLINCPICSQPFHPFSNDALNAHIDSCLNASTVRDLCREETVCANERARKGKKRTLNDFFVAERDSISIT